MVTQALFAHSTKLLRGDGQTVETFTALAEVKDIDGPGLELETIDVTNHDSTNAWEEHIGGILRSGEISFDINYVPDSETAGYLVSDMVNREVRNFKLQYPDDTEIAFTALVTGFTPGAPVEDALTAAVTMKLTGEPGVEQEVSGGLTDLTGVDSAAGALTFIPAFDNETYLYTVDVANTITYVKLTPTAASHTITVNGLAVTSGSESGELALGAAGTNTVIDIVAKETGKTPVKYTVIVTRAA